MIQELNVMLWGKKVGTLTTSRHGYREQICFYFDPTFAKHGFDIAPLRASITGMVAKSGLPVYPETDKLFGGLPSFIADSLPDHWGNTVFAKWGAANNIPKKALSPLDRLAYIGCRGMGALEFEPPVARDFEKPFKVEIEQLSKLAHEALNSARHFESSLNSDLSIESLFRVGTSAGGRRPKAVINLNLTDGVVLSGQVPSPSPDYTPVIIKFDEHTPFPSTRVEYSYYLMAKDAGLDMMESWLHQCADETHFLTQRFDRCGLDKIHTQTLAAMDPLSSCYEDLFQVAHRLAVTPHEMQQMFRHMVMNVLAANIDDHNKNFSFMMDRNGIWRIAPVYDFTFTVDTSAPFYINRHCMAINGKVDNITRSDLLTIASSFGIKNPNGIIAQCLNSVKNYRSFAIQAAIPEKYITIIESHITDRIQVFG